MSFRTGKSRSEISLAAILLSAPSVWRVTVVVCFLCGVAVTQKTAVQPSVPDLYPEKHNPSVDDLDRMSRVNTKNNPEAGVREADYNCLLPPLNLTKSLSVSAAQLEIAEKARTEYQKGCVSLKKKKIAEAEKHLQQAVSVSPMYAAAWVTLGQVLGGERRVDEARRACLQATVVEARYVASYLCLADLAAQERTWDEVLRFSARAIELDPDQSIVGYEYHAAAMLNLHDLAEAEKSGLRAAALDTNHREPRLHFVLAQIYEAKGDRVREAAQLQEYLQYAENSSDVALVKQLLTKLESQKKSATERNDARVVAFTDSTPQPLPAWSPAEIDERVPPVTSNASCPLVEILKAASDRTQDFIESFERFSATERIEEIKIGKNGKKRIAQEEVNYVAQVTQNSSGYPMVSEYRVGNTSDQHSAVVDSGIAATALFFHPSHIGNFEFTCEGLTQFRGVPVWQLRFEEGPDQNRSFTAIQAGGLIFLPRLKGRAWIATDGNEVLRIETDLMSPIPQINLLLEHMVIDYAPVEFAKHQVRLWLPESTTVYLSYRGHRYERTHSFSQFQLFSVDSVDSVRGVVAAKDKTQQLMNLGTADPSFDPRLGTIQPD